MLLSCASSLQKKLEPRLQAAVREGRAYCTRNAYNVEYRNWPRSGRNKVRSAAAQVCLLFVEDNLVLYTCTAAMYA